MSGSVDNEDLYGTASMLLSFCHELRTPMTSILGFAELLQDEGLAPAMRARHVERMSRNAEVLLRLIDDMSDYAQIGAGTFEARLEPASVSMLADTIAKTLGPLAGARGLGFAVECATELPAVISLDVQRAIQVLLNVLGHALKRTKGGQVTVHLGYRRHLESCHLVADVRSSGTGVALERQADAWGEGGFGLALGRRLARAMGGDVRLVDNQPGLGSHWQVTLPEKGPGASGDAG